MGADVKAIVDHLRESNERCPGCGYPLGGLSTDVCPECGRRVTLVVDPGGRGQGWWLLAVLGSGAGAAMAAGMLWMGLSRVAQYYLTSAPQLVKGGFQPGLNAHWSVLAAQAAATVALLGAAAWAGASRHRFARQCTNWQAGLAVALGATPLVVVGAVWAWGLWWRW